jgi:hypothetical protein
MYGLEPVRPAEALRRGLSYHEGVEGLLKQWVDYTLGSPIDYIEDPKIKAMVSAFNYYIIPKLASQYKVRPVDVEPWFSYTTRSGHTIIGRADGKMSGNVLIEHKTTSGLIDGAYYQRLELDEQIPTYMLAFGARRILYTVCSVPSIRQKKDESDDDFYARCVAWYEVDTESKINVVEITKSEEELAEFKIEQDEIVTEMERCRLFYRNPSHCTKWGRMCEYASVCMNYDPNRDYVGFKRRDENEKAGKTKA